MAKHRTAFEEALQNGEPIPSWYTAADTLSIANRNPTFLAAATDTVDSVNKFIGLSIISGANEIYNIPANVGNLLGADFSISKTEDIVAGLDSDMSKFYEEHKGGADLVGFMLSSLIPGIGGIKVLNAAQKSIKGAVASGRMGTNMGKALGLRAYKQDKITAAIKEVANGTVPASIKNANVLKALGAGFGQNVLEAAAFEIAVAATLYSSPVLENQDFGDFLTNIAIGGGVFGVFASAVDIAVIKTALNRASKNWDDSSRPFTFVEESAKVSAPHESIALDLEQLKFIPSVVPQADAALTANLRSVRATTIAKLEGRVRRNLGELSGNDQQIAGVFHGLLSRTSLTNQQHSYIDLTDLSRLGQTTKEITEIERMEKRSRNELIDLENPSPEELAWLNGSKHVAYYRNWGDDVGVAYTEEPVGRTLADNLSAGESISVPNANTVKVGKQEEFKFFLSHNVGKSASADTAASGNIVAGAAGDSISQRAAEARYIWSRSSQLENFADVLASNKSIHIDGNDIPLLEKLLREVPDAAFNPRVTIYLEPDAALDPTVVGLRNYLYQQKVNIANQMLVKNKELAVVGKGALQMEAQNIAKLVNVREKLLASEQEITTAGNYADADMLALDTYTRELAENLGAPLDATGMKIKLGSGATAQKEIWEIPRTTRAIYDGTRRDASATAEEISNFVTENMIIIKEYQRVYQTGANNASAMVLGTRISAQLPEITSGRVAAEAATTGAGPGLFTAASSNPGSLAALMEYVGSVTSRAIGDFKTAARETLEPHLYKLGQNQEASVEWAVLNSNVRNLPEEFGLNPAGDALIPLSVKRYEEQLEAALETGSPVPSRPVLDPNIPASIPLLSQEVRDLAAVHVQVNGVRTTGNAAIAAARGTKLSRSSDAFYPIPVNPRDYKHWSLVIDESITGGGANRTLFASNADELRAMKRKLEQNPQLKVYTKSEVESRFKDLGDWDYEKTLNSAYLNTEMQRAGTSSSFIVPTDPKKIVDDMLSWHLQREAGSVREAVSAKYEVQFEELKRLGDEATNIETSKFSDQSILTFAEETVDNPFASYIKTALGVKDHASYPLWTSINNRLDQVVSSVGKKVDSLFYSTKGDGDVGAINAMLDRAGYQGTRYDAEMVIFANSKPAGGLLSAVVQKANSTLATVVLRMDFLNAVNNAVSANVLLGSETAAVVRAISRGDEEAIGALAKVMDIAVPGADGATMQAPTKLIANAFKALHEESLSGPTMQFFRDNGYMTNIVDQYRDAIETLTFSGREGVAGITEWGKKIDTLRHGMRKAGDFGEKWTGNRLAEETNRFVAAHVMKQLSDVGVQRGLISKQEQLAYINTFVNRTQGNYLAAQRPMAFQGPIGQAIGLFQTYQFNLMQQLFRHAGSGRAKDAMTMIALQGTIHGMNGLPAFRAINTNIIGTASGNQEHKDIYSATYGIAGKEAGDFLLYGAASTALGLLDPALKVNLYTRGDLNPRHITLLPTDPAAVPFIQAWTKFAGNLFSTARQVAAGGDVAGTILQGLEHNGISRPLAGLAATLEGFNNPERASFSTSNRGNVIAANDLLSLANLARIAGGKPLDEAIAMDATYRFRTYALKDSRKRQVLGNALKSTVIAGNRPTREQIESFAENYAATGGRQQEFAAWMTQLTRQANTSQANEIARNLKSPFSQAMQEIMGRQELGDFSR